MSAAPALFVSHGAPTAALEDGPWARALARLGEAARPRAALVVSAHWQVRGPVGVTAAARPATVHDFYGFPPVLSRIRYGAPGDPALAALVSARLAAAGFGGWLDPERGLDHGAWVPLLHLFPRADVPVIQVALPVLPPERLLALGEALAPLRDDGVMVVASGGAVHNLGEIDLSDEAGPVAPWAAAFDRWLGERLAARDRAALAGWRREGPQAPRAHPTTDHFDPVLVALGAARPEDRLVPLHEEIRYGTLSMRTFAFGAGPIAA